MKKRKIGIKIMLVAIILTVPQAAFAMETGGILPKAEAPVIEAPAMQQPEEVKDEVKPEEPKAGGSVVTLEGTAPLTETPVVEQPEEPKVDVPVVTPEEPKEPLEVTGGEEAKEEVKDEGGIIEEIIKPVIEKITEVIEEVIEGITGGGEEPLEEEPVPEEELINEEEPLVDEEASLIIKHVLYLSDGELEFTEELTGLKAGEVIDLSIYEQRSANYYCTNKSMEVEVEAGTQEVLMEYAFRSTR